MQLRRVPQVNEGHCGKAASRAVPLLRNPRKVTVLTLEVCLRRGSVLDSHGHSWPWDSGMHWSGSIQLFILPVAIPMVGRCGER